MVRHKTDSGHFIGEEFPDQEELQKNYATLIRKINDTELTPKKQAQAIKKLNGITRQEMEDITETTGPELADTIRKVISKDRA